MISVVMPAYNVEAYIERSLKSVLTQTFQHLEIVLVDDGSSDRTVETAESVFRQFPHADFKILRTDHAGPGAARNAGIRASRFEWVAFLDADDFWRESKLEVVTTVIEALEDVDMICHYEDEIALDGSIKQIGMSLDEWDRATLVLASYHRNMFTTSGVTVRRRLLVDVGMFDETLPSGQDRDLWIRLVQVARPFWLRDSLGYYVNRPGNISSNLESRFRCSLRISRKYLPSLAKFSAFPRLHVMRAITGCRVRAVRHYLIRRNPKVAFQHCMGWFLDVAGIVGGGPPKPPYP
jgi:glycosyltransferase involved in cell wall biosynthesis